MKIKKSYMTDTKRQIIEEIHKPARIHFKRRKVIIKSLNDLFQADLVEMLPYAKENQGFKYILVVINCFSKFVWMSPLKNKSGKEVTAAMDKILKQQVPNNLQTDMGKEFFNDDFKKLMHKYNINYYSVYSEKKAAIVERVNRTLKNMMWKEFNLQGSYNWIKILSKIVNLYNNTKHRTIHLKPIEVTRKNEKSILNTAYNRIKMVDLKSTKFHLGDYVRISKIRGIFDKKYMPNWSNEIFTIRKVQLTNPITYLLKDANNGNVLGCFYQEQLQKTKYPNDYLVEKVLKRKGNKVLVKWLGFDNTHNSWINKSNVV